MYCQCMIATVPLATRNKLYCFISARGMLTIIWRCALVLFCSFIIFYFYMLINHFPKNKIKHFKLGSGTIVVSIPKEIRNAIIT